MSEFWAALDLGRWGVLGTVLTGFLAIYLWFRRPEPRLVYQYAGRHLISADKGLLPDEVEILYNGKHVSRLSQTFIIIWNYGSSSIRRNDIVASDPIRISLSPDVEILNAEIIKTTRNTNECKISIDVNDEHGKTLLVDFLYLDPNDGVLIKVLHAGSSTQLTCSGTIIGMPKGIESLGGIANLDFIHFMSETKGTFGLYIGIVKRIIAKIRVPIIILSAAIGLFMFFIAAFPEYIETFRFDADKAAPILAWFNGFFYSLFALIFIWSSRKRYPSSLEPIESTEKSKIDE